MDSIKLTLKEKIRITAILEKTIGKKVCLELRNSPKSVSELGDKFPEFKKNIVELDFCECLVSAGLAEKQYKLTELGRKISGKIKTGKSIMYILFEIPQEEK